ncbi:hypothetical protein UVI_02060490 [Ustilaginoidea virens]|uniref:AAA+ ATPase domain-containing protein n=1 Tax=Ustilaginoidea virens TaxID=1159556 RepID=A0A1B5L997_USTVR|nr:hypothetical protein UVI_02060490 [Ustilaginoidea virens]
MGDASFGLIPKIRAFYEVHGCEKESTGWVSEPPKELSSFAAREHDGVAIKVFKARVEDKLAAYGSTTPKYFAVQVQNPALVDALKRILREKMGRHLDAEHRLEFFEPFTDLWFCRDEIANLRTMEQERTRLMPYLQLLLNVMNDMFSTLSYRYKFIHATGFVDFHTAWTLFPRGCQVYTHEETSELVCKIRSVEYQPTNGVCYLVAEIEYLTFSGTGFVWVSATLRMAEFKGNMPITEMLFFPLQLHPQKDAVFSRLVARGKKMLNLQGVECRCYDGIALVSPGVSPGGKGVPLKFRVSGPIIVDVLGYMRHNCNKGPRDDLNPRARSYVENADADQGPLTRRAAQQLETTDTADHAGLSLGGFGHVDGAIPYKQEAHDTMMRHVTEAQALENKVAMLAMGSDLVYVTGFVEVFFQVEDIQPIEWNTAAYDDLVYDAEEKYRVLSLVQNHKWIRPRCSLASSLGIRSSTASPPLADDFIAGKGQGLVVLLSGSPGTGKTLLVEAVTHRARRPIYHLQAEDFGTDVNVLATRVKNIFEWATWWNAVILLEDADHFMTSGGTEGTVGNELATIFLKELEYFGGIIFMTTKLEKPMDFPLKSRVNVHLMFPALGRGAREQLWRRFIGRQSESEPVVEGWPAHGTAAFGEENWKFADDKDFFRLSLWELNGREIFNANRLASCWCSIEGQAAVSLQMMERAIKITNPQATRAAAEDDYEVCCNMGDFLGHGPLPSISRFSV